MVDIAELVAVCDKIDRDFRSRETQGYTNGQLCENLRTGDFDDLKPYFDMEG